MKRIHGRGPTEPQLPHYRDVRRVVVDVKGVDVNSTRCRSQRVPQALAYAAEFHSSQRRKGKNEPYLSHILAVTALVTHHGGDEEPQEVSDQFGPDVADMALARSDSSTEGGPRKIPWREHKEAYRAQLSDQDPLRIRLTDACDKLANLRDLVSDYISQGLGTLTRFSGVAEGVLLYYGELSTLLVPQLIHEYDEMLDQPRAIADATLEAER